MGALGAALFALERIEKGRQLDPASVGEESPT